MLVGPGLSVPLEEDALARTSAEGQEHVLIESTKVQKIWKRNIDENRRPAPIFQGVEKLSRPKDLSI